MTGGRGLLIALDGIDGGGKSGSVKVVAAALRDAGEDPLVTREPGGTPEGLALRRLLLSESGTHWVAMAELLLLAAARAQHLEEVIRPALAAGRVVLCDRFVASTLAYQGAGRGLPAETILALHRIAAGDLWPDLTVILDVPVATGLSRSRRRLAEGGIDEGRFEALDHAFHERVRRSFLDQAAAAPERHLVIDAAGALPEVEAAVQRGVLGWLASRR